MDTAMHDPRLAIGGNNPPPPEAVDLTILLDPAILRDQYELDHAARIGRRNELLPSATRFIADHEKITTEDQQVRATDIVKQLKTFLADVEAQRKIVGRPFLDATGVVQAFFSAFLQVPLAAAVKTIENKMTDFASAERYRKRKLAEDEALKRQQEANRLAAAAEKAMDVAAIDQAVAADGAAQTAQRRATVSSAALVRSRGDHGGVGAFHERWDFEVTNVDEVPSKYRVVDRSRVMADIKAGARDIAGLRIFDASRVVVR